MKYKMKLLNNKNKIIQKPTTPAGNIKRVESRDIKVKVKTFNSVNI